MTPLNFYHLYSAFLVERNVIINVSIKWLNKNSEVNPKINAMSIFVHFYICVISSLFHLYISVTFTNAFLNQAYWFWLMIETDKLRQNIQAPKKEEIARDSLLLWNHHHFGHVIQPSVASVFLMSTMENSSISELWWGPKESIHRKSQLSTLSTKG